MKLSEHVCMVLYIFYCTMHCTNSVLPEFDKRLVLSCLIVFPPEEMVTSLPIGSSIFGTLFLITVLHPILLPVLDVNSVCFTTRVATGALGSRPPPLRAVPQMKILPYNDCNV